MRNRQDVHMEIISLVPGLVEGDHMNTAHEKILGRLQHLTAENDKLRAAVNLADLQIRELISKEGKTKK